MSDTRTSLVLLNRLPYPLDDGWRVRTYNLVRALAREGQVTILAFGREGEASTEFRTVVGPSVRLRLVPPPPRYRPWQLLKGLLGREPLYVVNERSRAFGRALAQELALSPPARVVCGLMAMYHHMTVIACAAPVLVDTHNIDSLLMRRYAAGIANPLRSIYARVTAAKLRHYEEFVLRGADAVIVCSHIERSQLLERVPTANVWVVPNGASLAAFQPRGQSPIEARLLFFGRLDYRPNTDALRYFLADILPRILSRHPGTEFHVAGIGADAGLVEDLSRARSVVFHGRVDDLASLVHSANVVVVPLRMGGGTRLKILEAMAAGRPVVSTTIGAEGLEVESERELLLRDDPTDFADAVVQLVQDPAHARTVGQAGQRLVTERYEWEAVGSRLLEQLRELDALGAGRISPSVPTGIAPGRRDFR